MNILALDTATDACSVALLIGDQILQRLQIAPRRHAELILPMMTEVLAMGSITCQQLDLVAVGSGPGSFMGVRIAAAVAQGVAFAADLPVIMVSTLQALAQTAYSVAGVTQVLAAWDARMSEIYWGAYGLQQGIMQPLMADRLDKPEAIWPSHSQAEGEWALAGNAWQVYPSACLSFKEHVSAELTELYPEAKAIASIAAQYYAEGKAVVADKVLPTYIRNQVTR